MPKQKAQKTIKKAKRIKRKRDIKPEYYFMLCTGGVIKSIKELSRKEAHYKIPEKAFPYDKKKPNVKLLGTGGTIASRLDYRTGAVIPAFSPGELYGSVPELAEICNLETEKLYGVFSENMGPEQWRRCAEAVGAEIKKGVKGL